MSIFDKSKDNEADPVQPVGEEEPVRAEGDVADGPDYNEVAAIQAKATLEQQKENERLRKEVAKDRDQAQKDAEKAQKDAEKS